MPLPCLTKLGHFSSQDFGGIFREKKKKQYLFLLLPKNLQKILTTLKILVSFECAHLKFHLLPKAKLALRLARLPQYQKVEGSFLSTKNLAKQFCSISDKIFFTTYFPNSTLISELQQMALLGLSYHLILQCDLNPG